MSRLHASSIMPNTQSKSKSKIKSSSEIAKQQPYRVPKDEDSWMCQCRLTNAYFVSKVGKHLNYFGRDWFMDEYKNEDFGEYGIVNICDEVERQLRVRKADIAAGPRRQKAIIEGFKRVDPEIYMWKDEYLQPDCVEFVRRIQRASGEKGSAGRQARIRQALADCINEGVITCPREEIYCFKSIKPDICKRLSTEIRRIQDSDYEFSRPNSMNNNGLIMREIGFENFVDGFVNALAPLCVLFPRDCGDEIDSWRSFTVHYDALEGDRELALHYDNAEMTINVNIYGDWAGGNVAFFGFLAENLNNKIDVTLGLGDCAIHYGKDRHQSLPVTMGSRRNLIIWCRSSEARNEVCPMHWGPPRCVKVNSLFHEGFTVPPCDVAGDLDLSLSPKRKPVEPLLPEDMEISSSGDDIYK